jgi:hypothetical protein
VTLSSPWGSSPRGPLRVVLAAVLTFDIVDLVKRLHERAAGPESAPHAPRLVLALGGTWLVPSLLAAVGGAAALRFARRPRALGAGAVALFAHGALVESLAAVRGARWHNYYSVAAALSGWLAVLAFQRLGESRDSDSDSDSDVEVERLAEHGAAAGLAATYVGAFTSKLLASGASWLSPTGLRALLIGQTGLVGEGLSVDLARAIVSSTALPTALLAFVAAAQLSALAYPFTARARAVVGTALIAFHLGTLALTPVFYFQATELLLAFSYPWPALFACASRRFFRA